MKKYKLLALFITLALLSGSPLAQQAGKKDKNKTLAPAATANPVIGAGTPGRISRWAGIDGTSTYTLGDSNIFEDKFGKIGIGTATPTSPLTIKGMVETTLGGYKFPDGTVQTTAGIAPTNVVKSLNGLKGDLQLAAGSNITITPAGNTLTVGVASPLEVRDLDNPARQPVQYFLNGDSPALFVPQGKRLVIEFVSGFYVMSFSTTLPDRTSLRILTSVASQNIQSAQQHRVLADKGETGGGTAVYHTSQAVKFYADPGTQVTLAGPTGNLLIQYVLTGYFIDVP
jgi:hypothetical protein